MERSYFSCNYSKESSYVVVYPISTLLAMSLFDSETEIEIEDLYIEKGEMLIDKPCPVYTEQDFNSKLKISDIVKFLNSRSDFFVMNFKFSIQNSKINVKINDDTKVKISFKEYSKTDLIFFLERLINLFPYETKKLQNSIINNSGKYVCINENGNVWKIINTYNELLEDDEVLATY